MEAAIWAALVAGATGVVTGGLGLYSSRLQAGREDRRQERIKRLENDLAESRGDRERHLQAEAVLARYRDPLITATFELQDRLQNLLRPSGQNVLVYLRVEDRAELAITSTLFRFAQYFGWTEVIRREIQFLQFDATAATRKVQDAIGKVGCALRPTSSVRTSCSGEKNSEPSANRCSAARPGRSAASATGASTNATTRCSNGGLAESARRSRAVLIGDG